MTAVDVEVESIEHLDFSQVCEVALMPALHLFGLVIPVGLVTKCEEPAVGIVRCRGCGDAGVCCQKHCTEMLTMVGITCTRCMRSGSGADVYSFEPLRVKS